MGREATRIVCDCLRQAGVTGFNPNNTIGETPMLLSILSDKPLKYLARQAVALIACAALVCLWTTDQAKAEAKEVRISKGYGILYLPLIVMEQQKLLEKHAAAAGLGPVQVNWVTLDGGNVINDAMLAGTLDIAGIGAPGFITMVQGPRDCRLRGDRGQRIKCDLAHPEYQQSQNQIPEGFRPNRQNRLAWDQDIAVGCGPANAGRTRIWPREL